ncbi:Soluble epoxide hydrolase [Planktothrix tepida]|uniref:Alpha/beta hydrolase fold protein n=1 Tax=Planktothrix tepida PCC 9214 TaxID=671072 RepID=A0A1J1LPD3_9CYAN|nr:alpha/beta hydrolase [Planktothrix tepida]CAD5973109.1 Soluble epoxide hydrolase [Planktothrix tepida]CUR34432.1 Alpha/beta hydrolase fold protein [Planktothrix tepida PCC 9214]
MSYIRKTLSLSRANLSYLEWNPGVRGSSDTNLLLLHGLADQALVWKKLGEKLSDHHHIIAPDMRGHGESSKPEQGYTFTEVIEDLEALMDQLNWSKAHILGHSWTGKMAAIWARQNPDRFNSMILVDPIFIMKLPGLFKLTLPLLYRQLDCLKLIGPFASFEQAENQAKQLAQFVGWSDLQQELFEAGMEQKPDGTWGSKFGIPARNEIFEQVMEVPGLTENINIPTLLIQPEKGVNRMDWQLKPYQQYLTQLKIERVAGNHWSFLVEPDCFNQTVEAFLKDQMMVK